MLSSPPSSLTYDFIEGAQHTILATGASTQSPLALAGHYSHFAQRWLARWQTQVTFDATAFEVELSQYSWTAAHMQKFLQQHAAQSSNDETLWMQALRQLRNRVIVNLIARDLSGRASLAEVMETMTCLAEVTVQTSLAWLTTKMVAQYGQPIGQSGLPLTMQVVGMGKLGGRELNVSSDIDLIFLYEEEGETQEPSAEYAQAFIKTLANEEFFTRLAKKLINLLSENTEDGFVFRVDMRLRPNGDAGPLVCSLAMLETYLLVQGREWERYAWIKGRVVSETQSPSAQRLRAGLESLIHPFVYRRYLDFGVIAAIRDLHRQIRSETSRKAHQGGERNAARNIKLGQGGIREIEFMAQVFQLMRGGQDAALRVRPTLQVLACAATRGLLPADEAEQLRAAYVFLRSLEHRLQYVEDAQTHQLPVSAAEQARIAGMMGYSADAAGYAALMQTLEHHTEHVWQQFAVVFSATNTPTDSAAEQAQSVSGASLNDALWSAALLEEAQQTKLQQQLQTDYAAVTDAQSVQIVARLKAAWQSPRLRSMSEASRQRYDRLVQQAMQHCLQAETEGLSTAKINVDESLSRALDFLEAISRRASYLSLLTEYPLAFIRLCDTLSASRWAASYLTQHPQLLDELLLPPQAIHSEQAKDYWTGMRERLEARLAQATDNIEAQLDALRQAHHVETFRILLADMQGALTVEEIGDRLSELADMLLAVTLNEVWRQLPATLKDKVSAPAFAIIAYGKLGGKELGYVSDLDIIFLYDDSTATQGDVAELYASYARKIIFWLTTHTPAGTLFDIDTRLRPNGEAGLLVTSLKSFQRYQLREGDNTAWIWEHQALSRARFSAGDVHIGQAFEEIRHTVLTQVRDASANATLRTEIIAMREKMLAGHPNHSALFDLKHDRGGMVDIEFIVQYLVLRHAAEVPALCRNAGNIALLGIAGSAGLIDAALATQVAQAYRQFRALQHALRLNGVEHARVADTQIADARAAVLRLWEAVLG